MTHRPAFSQSTSKLQKQNPISQISSLRSSQRPTRRLLQCLIASIASNAGIPSLIQSKHTLPKQLFYAACVLNIDTSDAATVLPKLSNGSYGNIFPKSFLNFATSHSKPSGKFHSSDTENTAHWTLRGFDRDGIARVTYHVFPWGTSARFGFSNGGQYWARKRLWASQCYCM